MVVDVPVVDHLITIKRSVLQVVLTTIEPRSHGTGSYDAYEYVVHSHQYITDDIPAARFSYELSPIQVQPVSTASVSTPAHESVSSVDGASRKDDTALTEHMLQSRGISSACCLGTPADLSLLKPQQCGGVLQIVVTEQRKAFYHFITTLCAIVGGVFTVAGIVDGLLHQTVNLSKKLELGKQT